MGVASPGKFLISFFFSDNANNFAALPYERLNFGGLL